GTQALVKSYQCPSDDPNATIPTSLGGMVDFYGPGDDCGGSFNKPNMCIDYIYDLPVSYPAMAARQPGGTNYIPCAGGLGAYTGRANDAYRLYPGIYYPNSKVKLTEISDGTSNTLAFGETVGGYTTDGQKNFHQSWMGASGMAVAWGLPSNFKDARWYMYSSKHAGGLVQFAFGDGSVKGVRSSISSGTYRALGGRSDGYVLNQDY
ncbi:MAG TPA: DUF1559 domain-containing protein, partial [Fimbriiglobus sp.]|nr:DUF1559 domain-containing protein [Fimbriiglobus sp.]